MSSLVCAGCNRQFTHAGYSRHLSMTTHTSCHALYDGHLDHLAVNSSGTSGPGYYDPSGDAGPEAGNYGEYPY
jgi:hypothetical protein